MARRRGEGRLLVGLVLEAVDARPAFGVVARRAGEDDGGAAVGPHHPAAAARDGQRISAERDPVVARSEARAAEARSIGPP